MKIHLVKQGDTLYSIAKKYNVSLEDIIKANPEISNPDAINVGMKVKIPSKPKSALEVIHHHIVQQGDTLWKLSKAWGIHLTDLIKANPQLKNPNALLTGEVVNIPKNPHGADTPGVTMQGSTWSGKAKTGTIPGTGMKPDTGLKPDTGVQPVPIPLPTPIMPVLPAAPPLAPVMPIPDMKPIYGFDVPDHVDLFKQYPVPMVQASAPVEMPYCPDPLPYGYGMQQPSAGPESNAAGHGYGYQPGISQLGGNLAGNLGGLYSHNDYIGYGPYNAPMNPTYVQGLTSAVTTGMKPPTGCKTCGGPSAWPTALNANAGAIPYPDAYPGGYVPYATSPSSVAPFMGTPYGGMPQDVRPLGNYSGNFYGGYPGAQFGELQIGAVPGAHAFPGVGGVSAQGFTTPAIGYGPQAEPYYGGIPSIPSIPPLPPLPPIPPMPPLRPLDVNDHDDRSSSNEGDVTIASSPVKKRQAKPKPKLSAARLNRSPKRKENLPWIKW